MEYRESAEQKIFVRWFKTQYPQFSKLIYSIPNEGKCKPHIGQIRKDMGKLAGIPDICIAVPTMTRPGLYIEMKSINEEGKKSGLSTAQREIHLELKKVGYRVETCWTADEAIAVAKDYLKDFQSFLV